MTARNFYTLGVSLVLISTIVTGALAQGIGTPQDGAGKVGRRGAMAGKRESPLMLGLQAADLTDAQKDTAKGISKKYRDERRAIVESLQPGNDGATKPQVEIRAKITEIEAKELAEVKAVLTAEQLPKFQAAYDAANTGRSGNPFGNVVERLALTDGQKTQIMPIITSTGDAMATLRKDDSLTNRDKMTRMRELFEDAKTKIRPFLTADQQKTLDEIKALRGGAKVRGAGRARPGA